jgi:beta-barrel assembly-enhancing protease
VSASSRAGSDRRRWLKRGLGWGCAHCTLLGAWTDAAAQTPDAWTPPPRHQRPDVSTDEGGLWAMMDREETRLRRSSFVVRNEAWRQYVSDLACKLGGEHCADTRVYTVRMPFFNASMAPNGMMQVWSGLLLRIENEAQLVSVLGHEIGHYLQRHSLERMRDAQAKSAFMALMIPFGLVGLVGQMAAMGSVAAFSRDNEREADRIGLALMKKSGHDPREASKVWANVRAELTAGAGGDPAKRSVFLASHPGADERQQQLEQLAQDSSGFVGEDVYQSKVEPLLWELLEDELKRAQYDETLVLLERKCARQPRRGDLRWFSGEARRLRDQGDDAAQALAEFNAALELDKPPAQAHRSIGLIHRQQGRKQEALSAFERYVQAAPTAPDAGLVQTYISELRT